MKRFLSLFVIAFLMSVTSFAEHHVIEVQRFPQWGHKYLTVANAWNGWYLSLEEGKAPQCMDVITEVNGVTTDGMPEGTFYELLNTSSKLNLKLLRKQNGKNMAFSCTIKDASRYLYFPGGIDFVPVDRQPKNEIRFAADSEIDYFEYSTFDYLVSQDDPLTDKNILIELSKVLNKKGFVRSTEKPDFYLTLTKDLQQSANVASHVVSSGSVSQVARNIWTGQNYLVEQKDNKIVTSTNVAATMHFTFVIYDGAKYRKDPTSRPVVWQLNYDRYSDEAINLMGEVSQGIAVSLHNFPFNEPKYSVGFYSSGIVTIEDDLSSGYIFDVMKGTNAYEAGMRAGDRVVKAYEKGKHCFVIGSYKATYFKANSKRRKGRHICYFYMIPLFPGSACKCPSDLLSQVPYDGDGDPRPYDKTTFVMRHQNGKKYRLRGLPANMKTFVPCDYILTNN